MYVVEATGQGMVAAPATIVFKTTREEHNEGLCIVNGGDTEGRAPDPLWQVCAATLLGDFARMLDRSAILRLTRIVGMRRTVDALGDVRTRRLDVFALTGRLVVSDGRFLSIGWSGRGDGLMHLTEPAAGRLMLVARAAGQAEPAESGDVAAVLDHQPAAVLAHEAIGHFAEAPAHTETNLDHRLGCALAPEWMTAVDNPRHGGAAQYAFDDEGTESVSATVLLRCGRLAAQLHSSSSAARASVLPTGNARSSQAAQPPIPRLSNLLIGGGDAELNAMLDRMNDGFFIRHLSHGYSRGAHVEARVVLAERVQRGRLTGRFVSGGRIVERADLFLRAQEATRETKLNPNAMCGKHGQVLYDVGTVAPAVRMSTLRVQA